MTDSKSVRSGVSGQRPEFLVRIAERIAPHPRLFYVSCGQDSSCHVSRRYVLNNGHNFASESSRHQEKKNTGQRWSRRRRTQENAGPGEEHRTTLVQEKKNAGQRWSRRRTQDNAGPGEEEHRTTLVQENTGQRWSRRRTQDNAGSGEEHRTTLVQEKKNTGQRWSRRRGTQDNAGR
ncbi:hypothetical protein V5799_031213 [Amblyomma americanum]|uniref:Uncharacterized protein n=1 Tax=Amblyomma americanum TaxID=6943 RepID=A0AAQ4ELZ4_AMBAM